MATPILNFTFTYDTDEPNKVVFTDITEYDEEVVVNARSWTIEKSDGTIDEVFPLTLADKTATYILDKDYALRVTLHINKILVSPGLSKTINLLAANNLHGAIYDLEKHLIDKTKDFNEKQLKDFIFELKLAGYFLKSATRLISTDIMAAQEALDFGNNQSIICNCN